MTEKLADREEPSLQPIITLYDAVTDSPVFRSGVYRYDQQLEHLEHWLDSLSRQLKLYTEKLNKLNVETIAVCHKALPEGIDETLIDPNFTGAVMKSFADALQTSLSFKAKLVSNLEESLISPLQQFVKTHLKEFKNFRKQHQKSLEKYEAQLAKYSALNKTKEPSAIREEAFRLHEARKEYVRMSGQHVLRILNFRSLLEHCLIERFSAATMANKDFYNDIQVWANLDAALAYWKQWLNDDKYTCSYQLHKQQMAQKRLEDEYIRLTAPDRQINKYHVSAPAKEKSDFFINNGQSKWGYLFVRVSRHTWARKWCFIHSGLFGSCTIDRHTNPTKQHPNTNAISIESRIRIANTDYEVYADTTETVDRRFCFEITSPSHQQSYILQAETEENMQDWIRIFNKNKNIEPTSRTPSIIIKSKSNPTTALSSSTTATAITEIVSKSVASSPKIKHADSSSSFSNISTVSINNNTQADNSLTLSRNITSEGPSIVMVSTTPDTEASLDNSSSLTPLLVWEAARSNNGDSTPNKLPSASWGIPLALVPNMVNLTEDATNILSSSSDITTTSKSQQQPILPQVIWPAKLASIDIPNMDILGYTEKMSSQNRELRRLFGGVKSEEVVLDAFVCCLRKKPSVSDMKEEISNTKPFKTTSAELYGAELNENEVFQQWSQTGIRPPSSFGHAYTGRGFITQDTFWLYSCVLLTCINTVAIRLKDIEDIQVIQDTSIPPSPDPQTPFTPVQPSFGKVIRIQLSSKSTQEPLIIGTLMDDIEIIAEKLRFAVNNAKTEEPMQIRNIFNKMQDISAKSASYKSVVLDLPLTFQSAIRSVQENKAAVVTKRLHAATFTSGSISDSNIKSNSSLQAKHRQRGDSEPPKLGVVERKKSLVVEPPKPYVDPDTPPSHVKAPDTPVECTCDDHLERQDAQITLPISAKRLYELMFSDEQTAPPTSGGVWEVKTTAIVGHNLSVSKWGTVDGKLQRVLKYWMPVSNPIVRMKEAEVVETQILVHKEEYVRYTVQISTKTAALPYADAFIPSVRYCITWINQSECQLTCYLGVKWVKSVLVRAIVTRAALKGMSDSVGVFTPILKNAAEEIKEGLDDKKRSHHAANHQRGSIDDTLSQQSNVGMESLVEEGQDDDEEAEVVDSNEHTQTDIGAKYDTATAIPHTASPEPISSPVPTPLNNSSIKITPSTSVSTIGTPKLDSSSQISNQRQKSSGAVKNDQKARNIKSSANKQFIPTTAPINQSRSQVHEEKIGNKLAWLSTVKEFFSSTLNLTNIATLLMLGFTFYMTIMWFRSGSKVIDEADKYLRMNSSAFNNGPAEMYGKNQLLHTKGSLSRSVYLRDLDEGFLRNSILPPYAGSESYKLFLETKEDSSISINQTNSNNNEVTNRHWYSGDHYRLAVDLDISRERIAMLRHDMLIIFQVLNKVDSQLVENEYMNWLLDTRLKCKYYPRLEKEDSRAEKSVILCNDIKKQLDKLF